MTKAEGNPNAEVRNPQMGTIVPVSPEPLATLKGGRNVMVTLEDGQDEPVFVRQLAVKFFEDLLVCTAGCDEVGRIALYTGKDRAWVEGLAPASHEALIAEGDRLNGDFFSRWIGRRKQALDLLPKRAADPGEISVLLEVLQKSNPSLVQQLMDRALPKTK